MKYIQNKLQKPFTDGWCRLHEPNHAIMSYHESCLKQIILSVFFTCSFLGLIFPLNYRTILYLSTLLTRASSCLLLICQKQPRTKYIQRNLATLVKDIHYDKIHTTNTQIVSLLLIKLTTHTVKSIK